MRFPVCTVGADDILKKTERANPALVPAATPGGKPLLPLFLRPAPKMKVKLKLKPASKKPTSERSNEPRAQDFQGTVSGARTDIDDTSS